MPSHNGKNLSQFFARKKKESSSSSESSVRSSESRSHHDGKSSKLKREKSFGVSVESSPKRVKVDKTNGASTTHSSKKNDRPNSKVKIEDSKSTKTEKKKVDCRSPPDKFKSKLDSFRAPVTPKDNSPKSSEVKPSCSVMKGAPGVKLTPLEQQVVAIKNKHTDTLLFVECGYKYRFFGEDAETAAKELNIIAHLDHSFMTASIPTHRLHVHVRKLVAKGYKVGVVKQTETAALKAAGSNKNAPFGRELTDLYTRATLIGEDVTSAGEMDDETSDRITSTLLVLQEEVGGNSEDSTISFVAIEPTTGDIVYDTFTDTTTRKEMWNRLDHIQPVEAVVAQNMTDLTVKAMTSATTRHGDCIRIERLEEDKFEYSTCLHDLCQLFEGNEEKLRHISELPRSVIGCLGATLHYLKQFKLDKIVKMAGSIKKYTEESHYMKLKGASLRNLEILINTIDCTTKGSLYWAMNQTSTKFGARLLQSWLVKPLLNARDISERQDMIEELINSQSPAVTCLKTLLNKLPDFERALTTIFHKKCSPKEFWFAVSGLSKVHTSLSQVENVITSTIESPALASLFESTLSGLSDVQQYADNLDETSAKEGKKMTLFNDVSEFPEVVERQQQIKKVEKQLDKLKPEITKTLKLSSFDYKTVSGLEYLIEVKNSQMKLVPNKWKKINMTKAVCRFRTPEAEALYADLQQLREQLQTDCHQAWLSVLDSFSQSYQKHRESVKCLAMLDVLNSLATVARTHDYCRPVVVSDGGVMEIKGGRHPVVSQLRVGDDSQYVANDTNLQVDGKRVMLVTGPNMGGKSCYMRQVALIAIMAQVGSFVPAQSARISILDGIYTRMGAADEIYGGRSTFMVEVEEAADIMKAATKDSLVILDELGRGTSTHDGVAIAMAALQYFLHEIKCLTIFVTHYLPLTEFEKLYPEQVGNYHMSFIVNEEESCDGVDVVTFLYQLTKGRANKSYGLNVARLAQIQQNILVRAAEKSKSLQFHCNIKRKGRDIFKNLMQCNDDGVKSVIENLQEIMD